MPLRPSAASVNAPRFNDYIQILQRAKGNHEVRTAASGVLHSQRSSRLARFFRSIKNAIFPNSQVREQNITSMKDFTNAVKSEGKVATTCLVKAMNRHGRSVEDGHPLTTAFIRETFARIEEQHSGLNTHSPLFQSRLAAMSDEHFVPSAHVKALVDANTETLNTLMGDLANIMTSDHKTPLTHEMRQNIMDRALFDLMVPQARGYISPNVPHARAIQSALMATHWNDAGGGHHA